MFCFSIDFCFFLTEAVSPKQAPHESVFAAGSSRNKPKQAAQRAVCASWIRATPKRLKPHRAKCALKFAFSLRHMPGPAQTYGLQRTPLLANSGSANSGSANSGVDPWSLCDPWIKGRADDIGETGPPFRTPFSASTQAAFWDASQTGLPFRTPLSAQNLSSARVKYQNITPHMGRLEMPDLLLN